MRHITFLPTRYPVNVTKKKLLSKVFSRDQIFFQVRLIISRRTVRLQKYGRSMKQAEESQSRYT